MAKAVLRGDGKWNCLTRVPARQGYGYHLCSKFATDEPDADGNPTKCAVHSEAGIARRKVRQQERDQQWRAKWARDNALAAANKQIEPALRKIAEGHNDARGLAQEVIAALDAARAAEGGK